MKKTSTAILAVLFLAFAIFVPTGCTLTSRNDHADTASNPLPSANTYLPSQTPNNTPITVEPSPDTSVQSAPGAAESPSLISESSEIDYSDFSIVGTWKNTGSSGFGQAQSGAIVIFDGANCNFFSPRDTYAFYLDGGSYRLDTTSFLFAETLSFSVRIVDIDQIEVNTGTPPTTLSRIG